MNPLRLTGGVLAVVAVVCLVLVQFLPWGGISSSGGSIGGFSFGSSSVDSYSWYLDANGEHVDWYDGDLDDSSGIQQIRTAVPVLLIGLLVVAVGAILAFTTRGAAGSIVALVGALVFAAGLILFAKGTSAFYDGAQDWSAAYYLAIVGGSLALLGGVMGLASGNRAGAA